jgi:hypothetical protein
MEEKRVNFFLNFSVSLCHVVPDILETGEDIVTCWVDNDQHSVDLSKGFPPGIRITCVVDEAVILFPVPLSVFLVFS